ncbi:MAG: hypothetical protein ACRC1Z_23695 [Waterburya sp.]
MNISISNLPKTYFLAQNAVGNEAARAVLNLSELINEGTVESWDRTWEGAINPDGALWQTLVIVGAILSSLTIIYYVFQHGEKLIHSPSYGFLINLLKMPIVVAVLFFNNGSLLVELINIMRGIAYYLISFVTQNTLSGIRINEAIARIESTGVANARAREIFSECADQTGLALEQCINDPVKIAQATDILQTLVSSVAAPFNGNLLEGVVNNATGIITGIFSTPFIVFTTGILIAWQWAFVNFMEMVLILTAIIAPIALGLSFIYSSSNPMFGWFSGFSGLLLYQFSYAVLVGFVATILANTEQVGGGIPALITDLGFTFVLSILAPIVAVGIGALGGFVLFQSLSGVVSGLVLLF